MIVAGPAAIVSIPSKGDFVAKKQRKVRVEFRKNRQKRTRENDLTARFRGNENDAANSSASAERVRAKGDLSRKRTVLQEVDESQKSEPDLQNIDAIANLAVDLSGCQRGRVVKIHGLSSVVELENGSLIRSGVRRILKTLAIDGRNVLAVGDQVWVRHGDGDSEGVIEKVETRKGVITRGYRRREHIIAANVDTVLIVSAFVAPGLKLPLIDRYLISAERGGARPVIVLNKSDLIDLADYQWVIGLYTQLGYEILPTSAVDHRGLVRLKEILSKGAIALSGQSGVGKSSLLNSIQPGLNLRVNEVSDWTFKGKHTTTHAELIKLEAGGYVVDTPGLRQFELWGVEPGEIEGHFPEFRPFVPLCKFPDCSHSHESQCAVKDAVHWGQIHFGRFESYLKLLHGKPLEED